MQGRIQCNLPGASKESMSAVLGYKGLKDLEVQYPNLKNTVRFLPA